MARSRISPVPAGLEQELRTLGKTQMPFQPISRALPNEGVRRELAEGLRPGAEEQPCRTPRAALPSPGKPPVSWRCSSLVRAAESAPGPAPPPPLPAPRPLPGLSRTAWRTAGLSPVAASGSPAGESGTRGAVPAEPAPRPGCPRVLLNKQNAGVLTLTFQADSLNPRATAHQHGRLK